MTDVAAEKINRSNPTVVGQVDAAIRNLGTVKDGLLLSASLLYLLGYAVWALNAKLNGLGPAPALDAQYFVAGLGPALCGMLAWVYWHTLYNTTRWLKIVTAAGLILGAVTTLIITALPIASVALSLTPVNEAIMALKPPYWLVAVLVFVLVASQTGAESGIVRRLFPNLYDSMFRAGVNWGPFLAFAGAVALYIFVLYPLMPQELGGGHPRCAYLELDRDKLSADVLNELAPPRAIVDGTKVVRTTVLDVYNSSKDAVVVKRPGADTRTYEIRSSAIEGLTSCP
jgi:hypothetical protein